MPRGGAHFTLEELSRVLNQYNIGRVIETHTLTTGNRRAPKKIIVSETGKFLLKRRARGKDDLYHVAFTHEVQTFLKTKGYAVAGILETLDNSTALNLEGHIYELFDFMPGDRFDGSAEAAAEAGRELAKLHDHFSSFVLRWKVLKRTYHDSASVRGNLDTIVSEKGPHEPGHGWKTTASKLAGYYDRSSEAVNKQGFGDWPDQIVHGDWHPGNMLFLNRKVTCVLDFDSAKIAPVVTDLANGALQFSILGGKPNPDQWPCSLDNERFRGFITGYLQIMRLPQEMLEALPDLMIEIMIAEAVLPIAATGSFGHLSGIDFLKMILRKCRWIDENRKSLQNDIF